MHKWNHSKITWRNLTFTFSLRLWFWRAVVPGTMASDLDFSPPEVPEPTFLENLLRYGLFLGAIFQLICVLAIIVPIPKSHEAVSPSLNFLDGWLDSCTRRNHHRQDWQGLCCPLSS